MSSVNDNAMGPVKAAGPELDKYMTEKIKKEAIHKLHEIHKAHVVHKFVEHEKAEHVTRWKPIVYAKEVVSYGTNYFVKVQISDEHYIHVRFHKAKGTDFVDFYSLHQTFRGEHPTCVWTKDDPLVYFNE